ncbi:MlaC/ttg2D family ABC transporter substrate-binding protein [Rhodovibrio sodomensis]|nr:ABC transporter substrate-binding protein [Rhodovibrio sodomensis]
MRLETTAWTRRLAVAAFSLLLGVAPVGPGAAAAAEGSPDGAAEFIESLGQDAVDELSRADVPEATRREQFMDLLERGFALEAISRFVLARYWRVASAQQRDRFQDVFKRVLAQRFLPLFKDYGQEDFRVTGARPDPAQPSLYAVRTLVARPGQTGGDGPKVEVIWRVRPTDGGYEIVDIKAEGVSMAITLRSEYNSAIQRAGGNIGNLIAMLEDNLAQGAYAPDGNGDLSPSGDR